MFSTTSRQLHNLSLSHVDQQSRFIRTTSFFPKKMVILAIMSIILTTILLLMSRTKPKNFPPSPIPLPIFGHLHLISLPLHQSLTRLIPRYGPTILLKFGSRPVLVISSPSAVDQCLSTHDIVFANRPRFPHAKHLSYNYTALAAVSYGPLLRDLRRIAVTEIFSPSRIRSFYPLFVEETTLIIKELVGKLCTDQEYTQVDLRKLFSELMFNVIMKIITGKRYFGVHADCDAEESRRLRDVIEETFEVLDAANVEDFVPLFRWIGFRKNGKRMENLEKTVDEMFQGMIDERRRKRGNEESTVIDVLLSLQRSDGDGKKYSDEVIKGFMLTIIAAGNHTSSRTMEWAMSLLLNHPETLQKLKNEVLNQVGHDRLINHSDIQDLNYLTCVIKETLRLYPVVPLLLPHESSSECTVSGFNIPKNTILFTNLYALHRDPNIWDEPSKFKPERFEKQGLYTNKAYLPFGLGRRSCPGEGMAMIVLELVLGALVQCFDWERIDNVDVDMSEGAGVTMPKAKHLEAKYKCQISVKDLCSIL